MKVAALFCGIFLLAFNSNAGQPDHPDTTLPTLPGKGLAQHDFFYAGENVNDLSMYVIKKGKVAWSYTHPGKGEISDAVLLSDGSIVFAHQFGVTKISKDKKILWNYDAPVGCEIHTAQPIGKDRVLFILNGSPAKIIVTNIVTGRNEKELIIPTGDKVNPHAYFRHARLTPAGNLLVAHLDLQKVAEYDVNGKEMYSFPFPNVWSAVPLMNGNILIGGGRGTQVCETDKAGRVIWQASAKDFPGLQFQDFQVPVRLSNGNTLINNRCGKLGGLGIQAIEVDPTGKMVWALRAWDAPVNLGPSTIIQLLDKKEVTENVCFGDIK